ncbi:hypothetical protein HOC35_05415 [Candidatus Woesearchaeota archaeon]|jgi:uncharacterized coiled-coil DUF342 family protein|nr:hypothetical protein [Candidatus Woesearchaeota archaeon]
MLNPEEKNKLLEKLKDKKAIVQDLRSKLNEINEQKESAFEKKDKISKEIRGNISQLKGAKDSRDKLTGGVKSAKDSRDELNKKIKVKINELKKLENDKQDTMKKHNIQGNPIQIKKQIEKLEYQHETSVMSFDKEKVIMSEIRTLRKQYEESNKVSTVWKKINEISKEIETLKKEANLFHRQIQTQANQSQEKHEVLITSSKVIKDFKKKEKEEMDKFLKFKAEFNEHNDKLKTELKELNTLYGKLDMNREEAKEVRKKKERATLTERKKEAEYKLKHGGKLTTEDILAMQSGD